MSNTQAAATPWEKTLHKPRRVEYMYAERKTPIHNILYIHIILTLPLFIHITEFIINTISGYSSSTLYSEFLHSIHIHTQYTRTSTAINLPRPFYHPLISPFSKRWVSFTLLAVQASILFHAQHIHTDFHKRKANANELFCAYFPHHL